jgi:hypothetical protein
VWLLPRALKALLEFAQQLGGRNDIPHPTPLQKSKNKKSEKQKSEKQKNVNFDF